MITTAAPDLPFRLTICGIPELDERCAAGVTHVLSILDPDFDDPPAFAAFGPHHRLALRFHDIIEPRLDCLMPQRADVDRVLRFGRDLIDAPHPHLLIHCPAGGSPPTASGPLILAEAWPDRPARTVLVGGVAIGR